MGYANFFRISASNPVRTTTSSSFSTDDFKGLDVGIQVGIELHPIQVVIAVNIGVRLEPEFFAPAG